MPKTDLNQVILYLTDAEKEVLSEDGNMQTKARKMIREYPILKSKVLNLIGEKHLKELLK